MPNFNTNVHVPQQVLELFDEFFGILPIHNHFIKIEHASVVKNLHPHTLATTQCLSFILKRKGDLPTNLIKIAIEWDEDQLMFRKSGLTMTVRIKGNLFDLTGFLNTDTDADTITVTNSNVDLSRAGMSFETSIRSLTKITTKTLHLLIEECFDAYEDSFQSRKRKADKATVHKELKSLILVEKNNISRNLQRCHRILQNIETLIRFEVSKNFKSMVATFKRKFEKTTELLSKV